MNRIIVFLFAAVFSGSVLSEDNSHGGHGWGYSGHWSPEHWASLSPDYSACAGNNQSPVNLTGFVESELEPMKIAYQDGGYEVINNGHSVQVNYKEGSYIELDGSKFYLKQFHFHAPSENNLEGKSYPLEAHLVHADKDGNLAVVAVLFEKGKANEALANAWESMPNHVGDKHKLAKIINAKELLPSSADYYRFNGSLTTPPCSEGVRWFVMKTIVTASAGQIEAFKSVMHEPNNRPVQPLNARVIMK